MTSQPAYPGYATPTFTRDDDDKWIVWTRPDWLLVGRVYDRMPTGWTASTPSGHNALDCRPERDFGVTIRAALEAAQPYMGATPVASPEAVAQAVEAGAVAIDVAKYFRVGDMERFVSALLAAGAARPLPTPVASRNRVTDALEAAWLAGAEAKTVDSPRGHCDRLTGALLAAGVFRPLPTREQIAAAVSDAWVPLDVGCERIVDAIAALLDGTERSPATNLDRAEEPK